MNSIKNIVFVDNEKKVLKSLKRVFYPMRKKWAVSLFNSPHEALEVISNGGVDVVFTDLKMPGMNGLELLQKVKSISPSTLRILLTGQADEEANQRSVSIVHQYLQKPCELETIKEVITRADRLQLLMENDNLSQIISQVDSLPSLPIIYNEIKAKIDLPETSAHEIGEIVSKDIAMSAKMLQLVNSSFFGLRTKITNPIDAVLMVGLNTVKSLVLSIKIFKKLSANIDEKIANALWNHSLTVGTNNKKIAEHEGISRKLQYDYFSAGMFPDLGKLFFLAYFPKEYNLVLRLTKEKEISEFKAEKEIFGSTNHHVGAYLMSIWGLPGSLVFPCAFNQEYETHIEDEYNAIMSLYFANLFASENYDLPEEFNKINSKKLQEKVLEWEKICTEQITGFDYE